MTPIDTLAGNSRLWFFQGDRFLNESEIALIEERMTTFVAQWTSHGSAMTASFSIIHNSLLIVAMDESQSAASGCGIDKCYREVEAIGKALNLDFMSRTTVLYQTESGIDMAQLNQFWAMKKAGLIDASTMVVDTTIGKLSDMRPGGLKRFDQTWHMEMWSH
jgi:hypothetical protein